MVDQWWLCVMCVVEGAKLHGFVGMGFQCEFVVAPWLWVCGYGFPAVIQDCGGYVVVSLWWLWVCGGFVAVGLGVVFWCGSPAWVVLVWCGLSARIVVICCGLPALCVVGGVWENDNVK